MAHPINNKYSMKELDENKINMITWDGFKRDKKLNTLLTIKTEDSPKER